MPLKLGQLLIQERLITPQQLEEALKYHVVYGLKLGSSLVEMGYVTEEQLARLLSKKLGIPRVPRKELSSAKAEAISKLTPELASKYRIIPFNIDRNRLSVAMSDPTDLKAIEELGFITGCLISTYIAPDVLIAKALSKFYSISSIEVRYQMLRRNEKKLSQEPQKTVTFPMKSPTGELINITVPAEFEGFAKYPLQEDDELYYPVQDNRPLSHLSEHERLSHYSIDQLSIDFSKAASREEVADVFIRYLGQEFEIGAIFIVFGEEAVGWRGIAKGKRMPGFEMFNWPLKKTSVLQTVVQTKEHVLGSLDDNPLNRQILFLLECAPATRLFAIPAIMHDEVVAIILVSADDGDFRSKIAELEKLVYKMSLAFEKLIIKLKILMT